MDTRPQLRHQRTRAAASIARCYRPGSFRDPREPQPQRHSHSATAEPPEQLAPGVQLRILFGHVSDDVRDPRTQNSRHLQIRRRGRSWAPGLGPSERWLGCAEHRLAPHGGWTLDLSSPQCPSRPGAQFERTLSMNALHAAFRAGVLLEPVPKKPPHGSMDVAATPYPPWTPTTQPLKPTSPYSRDQLR
jgi:hypothetical protein